ncbi:hypothetical protein [Marinibactrum halimedae]|nr:hypothetical protein [Marinibactrum halimedae]MCD9460361.1 hypothetical protein [Marinibactrum halimedae]
MKSSPSYATTVDSSNNIIHELPSTEFSFLNASTTDLLSITFLGICILVILYGMKRYDDAQKSKRQPYQDFLDTNSKQLKNAQSQNDRSKNNSPKNNSPKNNSPRNNEYDNTEAQDVTPITQPAGITPIKNMTPFHQPFGNTSPKDRITNQEELPKASTG